MNKDIIYEIFEYLNIYQIGKFYRVSKFYQDLVIKYKDNEKIYEFSKMIIKKYGEPYNRCYHEEVIKLNDIYLYKIFIGYINKTILIMIIKNDSDNILSFYLNRINNKNIINLIIESSSSKCLNLYIKNKKIDKKAICYRIRNLQRTLTYEFIKTCKEIFEMKIEDCFNMIIHSDKQTINLFIKNFNTQELLIFQNCHFIYDKYDPIILNIDHNIILKNLTNNYCTYLIKRLYDEKKLTNKEVIDILKIYSLIGSDCNNEYKIFDIIKDLDKTNIPDLTKNNNFSNILIESINAGYGFDLFRIIYFGTKNWQEYLVDHPFIIMKSINHNMNDINNNIINIKKIIELLQSEKSIIKYGIYNKDIIGY